MNQENPREQRTPSPLVHIELSPAKKTPRKLRTPFKTPSATTLQLQPDSTPKTLPSKLNSPDSSNSLLPPHIPAKRTISNDNSLPKGTTTPHREPTSEATPKSQNTPPLPPPINNSRQIDDLSQHQKSQRNASKNNTDIEVHQHEPPTWPPRTPLSMIISTSQPDAEKALRGNASSSITTITTTTDDDNTASTPRRGKSEFIRGTPRKLLHVVNTTCTIGEEVDDFRGGGGGGGGGENSMIFHGPRKLRVSSMVRKINEDEKRERRAPPKLRRKGEATAIATA